ncbi:hypothetical protein [Rubritalea tangerina]|uniref:hypothetical protein n=1 Tax=Rubritalea tangerina TaxID=430798 RepID=UPI003609EF45
MVYVMSFAQPHQSDNRLWKLWNVVEQNLEQDWTLQSLSQLACLVKNIFVGSVKNNLA